MVPHWAVDSQVAAQVSFLPHARKVHQDRSDRHEDGRALGQPAQALLAEVSVHEHRLEGGGQSDTRGRLTLASRLAVHATAHWCVHDSMGVACHRHGRQRRAAVARRQRCAAVTRNEAGGRGDDEREKWAEIVQARRDGGLPQTYPTDPRDETSLVLTCKMSYILTDRR